MRRTRILTLCVLACALAVCALCAVLAFKKIHPVAVIGIAAALGLVCGYVGILPQ